MSWRSIRRTRDRRFFAALNAVGGGGWEGSVSGAYAVCETTSGRVLGYVPFFQDGGDGDPVALEFDYEDDARTRLVARTVLTPHGGGDVPIAAHAFDVAPPGDGPVACGDPPAGPCAFFELVDPPTPDALVNLVDALRGRLCCDLDERRRGRDRDPRTVRLVGGGRVAVELLGDAEPDVVRRAHLDRPAVLTAPPLRILAQSANPYSGERVQFRVDVALDAEVRGPIDVLLDGVACGAIERPSRGEGWIYLRVEQDARDELVRCVPFPLRVRARQA
jgi:hypothetical protein